MPASLHWFAALCFQMFWTISLATLAQTPPAAPASQPETPAVRVARTVTPSVVLIKAGADGNTTAQGTGVIVREDGVILTAYHLVKDAVQVQVVTKDGETFDRVQLLGVDERRDVAAIRVAVQSLRAVRIRAVTDEQIGERVFALSNPLGMNWTLSDGLLSGVRLADDVPGAGSGFKLLQFTAPSSPGSSGGVLVDSEGNGIGLITGGISRGQNLNFAVPLSAVSGLTQQAPRQLFASGLPLGNKAAEAKIEDRSGKAAAVANVTRNERLRDVRLLYVYSRTDLCRPVMLHNELIKHAEKLDEWEVKIVEEERLADIIVTVDNMPMTFFYTFSIRDVRAGIILGAGRVTAWDCNLAAPELATAVVKQIGRVHEKTTLKKPSEARAKK